MPITSGSWFCFGVAWGSGVSDSTVLFLCTGNYYRSRFAEFYFEHLARKHHIGWRADSRGLQLSSGNVGPLSEYTVRECERLRIPVGTLRFPLALAEDDLIAADFTVAVKETEHRPLVRANFPEWENRIEYWEVHDLDFALPDEALPRLGRLVEELFERIRGR